MTTLALGLKPRTLLLRTVKQGDNVGVGTVLSGIVLVFTILPWWQIVRNQRVSLVLVAPLLLLTFSSATQLTFLVLWEKGVVPLDYSWKFAILGIPTCVLSLVLAQRMKRTATGPPGHAISCSVAGSVMWLFLISLH